LSASDAVVVPAPPTVLITSTVEIAGDSTTGVSWILLPNVSWPEAFLPLFDVVEELCSCKKTWVKQQHESWDAKQSSKWVSRLTWLPT
jgi:hypothetical protein